MGLRDADILCTYSSQENSIETMQWQRNTLGNRPLDRRTIVRKCKDKWDQWLSPMPRSSLFFLLLFTIRTTNSFDDQFLNSDCVTFANAWSKLMSLFSYRYVSSRELRHGHEKTVTQTVSSFPTSSIVLMRAILNSSNEFVYLDG